MPELKTAADLPAAVAQLLAHVAEGNSRRQKASALPVFWERGGSRSNSWSWSAGSQT